MSITLSDARIVTPDGVHHGWLTIEDGRITHVGQGPAPGNGHGLGGLIIVPGFVDIHVHGGGGAGYPAGSADQARRVVGFHRRHGTTTALASLVTAPLERLKAAAAMLAGLCAEGLLAGIHYEGPYISAARCGAHRPELLREPSVTEFAELIKAGDGHVRMFTLAPELPSALDAVRECVDSGVIAAIGHTDATFEQAMAAIDLGASVATHLFNAMRPLNHRDPGPITAAMVDERVTVEIVNDDVHLHPSVIDLVLSAVPGTRVTFITDAMDAAGMPDGDFDLGPMKVEVRSGVARLAGGGSIAGSTLTMDAAFRRGVQTNGLTLPEAARVTSLTPAHVLGLADEIGSITTGKYADLVLLDDTLTVQSVMKRGTWLTPPPGTP
ncbi:N-acetylglucosamine-6-phosphate deacetylase [Acrocarpospora phusangensis]|uniref:N-acetylglucosamine-6-phosphate deacetylase n=1 Tax=Acrocarpospora phusangensis TaxID=1070424 RepID=A0A919QK32_9ACTN|nr:N-acetylglucosamine-6-phosphate deacetylase [Acrocarpospora phusangensis]GIH27775.1 N-acetylglucosamine-6-phosphate deacetylase [Acrocarpospora phusangensis]